MYSSKWLTCVTTDPTAGPTAPAVGTNCWQLTLDVTNANGGIAKLTPTVRLEIEALSGASAKVSGDFYLFGRNPADTNWKMLLHITYANDFPPADIFVNPIGYAYILPYVVSGSYRARLAGIEKT